MPKRVWRVFYHPHLQKLAALWQAGQVFEFQYRLLKRPIFHKDLLGDPDGPYTYRYVVARLRVEAYAYDVLQSALEAHYRLSHVKDPWISISPYSAARELGICRAVTDAVLLAACQSGQYDKRVREVILQCCGLVEGE